MASVVDKLKKRKESKTEWSKTGSFLNKPDRGWIHPDGQLAAEAGICYGVRVSTVNILIFRTPKNNAVIIVKFEPCGFSIE